MALRVVASPAGPIYRIARRGSEPFAPPPWDLAGDDGTFGNRFDDPGGYPDPSGRRQSIAQSHRFRVIYCASTLAGAFGETVARVRPQLTAIPGLDDIRDEEGGEPPDIHLEGLRDPLDPRRGVIRADWRLRRQLYQTYLDASLRFVDLAAPETVNHMRQVLAPLAARLALSDVDLSTVTGPMRHFTQECARYVYEQTDDQGFPRYAGIRYLSRLNYDWECWAIFHDRMRHTPGPPTTIFPDHPDLIQVAALFDLTIETFPGHFLRP